MPLTLVNEFEKEGSKQYIFKSVNKEDIGVSITKYSPGEARFSGPYAINPIKFDENGGYELVEETAPEEEKEEEADDPIKDLYEDLRGNDYFIDMLLRGIKRDAEGK